ncbi:MAG TPA: family 43 glycosylhydrolase [Bacteroidales bacterium]
MTTNVFRIAIWLVFICSLSINGHTQSLAFKTYTNPVIPGDHSDCTLTQIGNDFYTTGSSFNPTPVIYHSTDLVHWEAIAQPVSPAWIEYGDKSSAGCWGGQVVYYNKKYWDYFSHAGSMWFTTADKIEGDWSLPVRVKNPSQLPYTLGYDNSIFIDDNGKWYLVVKNGQPNNGIVELGSDGQPTGVVYNLNWLNPNPTHPYSWAEGPVMWKDNGYYYYSFAHDVSGGQKYIRSKTLTDDKSAWTEPLNFFNENDPEKSNAIFFGPNHSSAAVKLADGTSWVLHPVWARANKNEWYGQGRQGILNQVHYDEMGNAVADYPLNKPFTAPKLPNSGIPWMVPKSDFFTSNKLNPEWSFIGQTATDTWSLTERPGWFRLKPKNAKKCNTIVKTDAEHNYSLITRVEFTPKDSSSEAGLRIINGMENLFVKLFSTINDKGQKVLVFSFDKIRFESPNTIGNEIWLKIERLDHIVKGFFSADGMNWTQVGSQIDVTSLDKYQVNYNGWCGNRQGLYVQGNSADFDLYIYRDAYTPILAECPANQFGTFANSIIDNVNCLDSIHNEDWALYAGVEFGGHDNYLKRPNAIEITASSATKGGVVEVWLDSIGTGKKIADCKIKNTNGWGNFKTFEAVVDKVEGRHDVYLRFKGDTNQKLFMLKSFCFDNSSKIAAKLNN